MCVGEKFFMAVKWVKSTASSGRRRLKEPTRQEKVGIEKIEKFEKIHQKFEKIEKFVKN